MKYIFGPLGHRKYVKISKLSQAIQYMLLLIERFIKGNKQLFAPKTLKASDY